MGHIVNVWFVFHFFFYFMFEVSCYYHETYFQNTYGQWTFLQILQTFLGTGYVYRPVEGAGEGRGQGAGGGFWGDHWIF